jgi:hypothetical protein
MNSAETTCGTLSSKDGKESNTESKTKHCKNRNRSKLSPEGNKGTNETEKNVKQRKKVVEGMYQQNRRKKQDER